VLIEEEDFA